jgi:hypothetical protein
VPSYGLEVKAAVSGDFKYEVNEDGNSVEITGYAGSGGDIVIPAEIDGKEVTSIKWAAFYGCSGITGVTIPRSVTSIAGYTFANCSGLERIMVDEENPRYDSRNGCNALIESGSNTLVFGCKNTVIPNSVTSIGASAFFGRSGLTEVIIPDGVTSIGDSAFCGCSDLTGLIIPDSVTSIGASAFSSCRGLTGVVIIPDGVTSIGYRAFEYCSGLMEVIIPDSVTSIGWQAFAYCRGLTGVTIPSSVTSIGDHAFSDCRSLESILVEEENPKYDSRGNCNALIESESNTLIYGCKNTVIPDSVTSIGWGAFSCSSLTGVTIPNSVTSIDRFAFSGCSGLTEVTIPSSVTSIGVDAFSGCSGLESIRIEEGNPQYDSRNSCNAVIGSESNMLIFGCKNTVIPDSVTSIGASAFDGCSGLTGVMDIPDSVTSIGNSAFYGCSGLTGVTIPDSVESIGMEAFSYCTGLTGVIISDSVTSIGWGAFYGCKGLTGVTIPSSVTSIGIGVFSDCSSLESIMVDEGNPKYDSRKGCNALIESESNTLICGCKNTVIPNGVTSIVDRAFYGCSGLMGVMVIPDSVTSIGMYAFYDCIGLTGAVIPDSVTSISLQALGCFRSDDGEHEEMTDFIIYGTSGSEAERYAKGYGLTFLLSSDWELSGGGNDKNDISGAGITLEKTSYLYDGKPKTPSVTVTLDGKKLVFNTDYTVAYRNNTDAGTAMITVTGQGCYTGSKTVGFTIVKAEGQPDTSITCKKTLYKIAYGVKPFKITASSGSKMEFSSSNPKIAAVDKETGKVTVRNTGIATITIKAGEASKKVTVKVRPKKQSLKQAKAVKGRKLTVKWSKDKRASGYQVQISTDKKFKGNVKSKNLSKTSYTFTKLKTGRKYYARVRSYKKSGKETLYGAWSAAKSGGNVKK